MHQSGHCQIRLGHSTNQFPVDLVTFTEEIVNGKLFLCVCSVIDDNILFSERVRNIKGKQEHLLRGWSHKRIEQTMTTKIEKWHTV